MAKKTKKKSAALKNAASKSAKKTASASEMKVVKKVAKKVIAKKAVSSKSAPKKTESTSKGAQVVQLKQPPGRGGLKSVPTREEPVQPSRPPTRKIIGPGNSLTLVQKPEPRAISSSASATPASMQAGTTDGNGHAPLLSVAEMALREVAHEAQKPVSIDRPREPAPEPLPKLGWHELPANVPPHVRFIVGLAEKECAKAASSPFPFAKFISSLPQELCGQGFAFLLMSRDRAIPEIAHICKMSSEKVELILGEARTALEEHFFGSCREMYRKLTAQNGPAGKGIEGIVDQYLIDKIDRDFQLMIGETVLRAIRPENPSLTVN